MKARSKVARWALVGALAVAAGSAAAVWRSAAPFELGRQVAAAARPGDLYMYAATTCGWCRKAERWFGWHDVPYASCEIDRDAACRAAFRAHGGIGTPLFVVRGERVAGWQPEAIAKALGR